MSHGFVLLDKPNGMTSRGAGSRVARMFGAKTFGHVGTLDPMASGLLVIALGEATKMVPYLGTGDRGQGTSEKEYEFSIQWGIRTDTDDITGKIIEQNQSPVPSLQSLREACASLIGEIWQIPPAYSAVHINGQRAYELARAGKKVEIPARKVQIDDLRLLIADLSEAKFVVQCSTGTYVRSLVQQIAEKIAPSPQSPVPVLATCSMIRRTRMNGFSIKNAVALDFLENLYNNGGRAAIEDYLQPMDFGLGDIPVQSLSENDAKLFQNGGFIGGTGDQGLGTDGLVRIYSNKKFLGIGIIESGILKPKRVLNNNQSPVPSPGD